MRFTVTTQHGAERDSRHVVFPDFDEALSFAESFTPDSDATLCPQVAPEAWAEQGTYERGLFWLSTENRYAVITREVTR